MNEYIKGIFGGALIICLLMMNFTAPKSCYVSVGHDNVKVVTVGYYDE